MVDVNKTDWQISHVHGKPYHVWQINDYDMSNSGAAISEDKNEFKVIGRLLISGRQ